MAKAAQTTVTLKHLAAALAGTHEMAKKQSETVLTDFVGMIVKHLPVLFGQIFGGGHQILSGMSLATKEML